MIETHSNRVTEAGLMGQQPTNQERGRGCSSVQSTWLRRKTRVRSLWTFLLFWFRRSRSLVGVRHLTCRALHNRHVRARAFHVILLRALKGVSWPSSSAVQVANDDVTPRISPALYLQRINVFIIVVFCCFFKHAKFVFFLQLFLYEIKQQPWSLHSHSIKRYSLASFSSITVPALKSCLVFSLYEVNIFP